MNTYTYTYADHIPRFAGGALNAPTFSAEL